MPRARRRRIAAHRIGRQAFAGAKCPVQLLGDFNELINISSDAFRNSKKVTIDGDFQRLQGIGKGAFAFAPAALGAQPRVELKDLYRLKASNGEDAGWFAAGFENFRFEHVECGELALSQYVDKCFALPTSTSTSSSASSSTSSSALAFTVPSAPSDEAAATDEPGTGMFTPAVIVVLAIGGALLVLILACVCFTLRRKRSAGFDFPAVQFPGHTTKRADHMNAFVSAPVSAGLAVPDRPQRPSMSGEAMRPLPPVAYTNKAYEDHGYEDPDELLVMTDARQKKSMALMLGNAHGSNPTTLTLGNTTTSSSADPGYEEPGAGLKAGSASPGYETADPLEDDAAYMVPSPYQGQASGGGSGAGAANDAPEYADASEIASGRSASDAYKGFLSNSPVLKVKNANGQLSQGGGSAAVYDNDVVVASDPGYEDPGGSTIFAPCEYDVGGQGDSGDEDSYATAEDMATGAADLESQFSPRDLDSQTIDFFLEKMSAEPQGEDEAEAAAANFSEKELRNESIDYILEKLGGADETAAGDAGMDVYGSDHVDL